MYSNKTGGIYSEVGEEKANLPFFVKERFQRRDGINFKKLNKIIFSIPTVCFAQCNNRAQKYINAVMYLD